MIAGNSKDVFFRYLLPRYFAHGLLFSIFTLIIGFVWGTILLGLIVLGALIGLIIGFLILCFIFGAVNTFLMDRIWNVGVDENWKSLLVHGFALSIAFLVVSIPSFIISLYAPSWPTTMVLFIIYCFIDGYVAKTIGGYWKEEGNLREANLTSESPPATERAPMELGLTAKLAVLLVTALAGAGFTIGLLLLLWSLLGGYYSEFLLFLTGFSGVVTLIGVIILSLTKG